MVSRKYLQSFVFAGVMLNMFKSWHKNAIDFVNEEIEEHGINN